MFIRYPQLQTMLGVSRATIHRMVERGDLVAPVKISQRAVGWPADSIAQFIKQRSEVVAQ